MQLLPSWIVSGKIALYLQFLLFVDTITAQKLKSFFVKVMDFLYYPMMTDLLCHLIFYMYHHHKNDYDIDMKYLVSLAYENFMKIRSPVFHDITYIHGSRKYKIDPGLNRLTTRSLKCFRVFLASCPTFPKTIMKISSFVFPLCCSQTRISL